MIVANVPKNILDGLNEPQKAAISHTGGPILVLAGAGSGKTKVITHRFAALAKKHTPDSVLAMTFTNKAAGEMKERIHSLTRAQVNGLWIGTFHSQCNRILRKEIPALGYNRDFSIYDEDDQCTLIRHILKEFKIYEAIYRGMLSRISSLKSSCISPDKFLSSGDGFGSDERLARVYVRYQDELKRCNALDYDDLIMQTVRLFEEHPDILKKYQKQFQHVLVDEFQDTNDAQYRLVKLLAGAQKNICAVGDDDQSIYAFRGANIKNILQFEKDFPDAKVVKLEQNYRSTQPILDASGHLIKNNEKRHKKTLWSDRTEGEQICRCWFNTEVEEAVYVAKMIREFYLKGIYNLNDFAILYRTNAQSKAIEDALRREHIAYKVVGGVSFYHRKEVKDMSAYMKLVLNPDDNVALRRIINVPARGIGASTFSKVEQYAKKNGVSLFDALKHVAKAGTINATIKEKIDSFVSLLTKLTSGKFKHASDLLQAIYDKTGFEKELEDARRENVLEFIKSGEGRDIKEFADTLCLVQVSDEFDADSKAISLMTLHSAKGLEFPAVFVTGLEEGVLPYYKAETPEEVAEERRLLYVGMTRAKDLLWLTGAGRRRVYAKVQEQKPSRFLETIPEHCCRIVEKVAQVAASQHGASKKALPVKTFKPKSLYTVGSRVRHPKWGVGIIRDSHGHGEEQKLTVNFPVIGVKRLALKFVNLERV